jgi:hypothetical protein
VKRPEFYSAKNLESKRILFILYLAIGLGVLFLAMVGLFQNISNYNDKEYLSELLLSGKSYASFDLLKKEIIEDIIWIVALMLSLLPVTYHRIKKIKYVHTADSCAKYFAKSKKPFVDAAGLPAVTDDKNKKNAMKAVREALRRRYLLNCTLEMHDGVLQVALAKKIVKDKCPSCNGPIVGAVDENYRCKYCNNVIMSVVQKQ